MNLALRIVRAASYLALVSVALVSAPAAGFLPADDEVAELVPGSPAQGFIQFTHDGISTRVARGWPQPILTFHVRASNRADDTLGIRGLDLWLVTDAGTVLAEPQLRHDSVVVDRVDVAAGEDAQFEASFHLGPTGSFDGFTLYWGARLGSRVLHGAIAYEADGAGYRPPDAADDAPVPVEDALAEEGEPGDEDLAPDQYTHGDTYVDHDYYGYYPDYYPGFTFGLHYGYYPYYSFHLDGHHHDGHHVGDHDSVRAGRGRSGGSRVATRARESAGRSGVSRRPSTRSRASTPRRGAAGRNTVTRRGSSVGRSGASGRVSSRSSSRGARSGVSSPSRSRSRSSVSRPSSGSRSSVSRSSSRGGSRGGGSRVSRGSSRGGSRGGGAGASRGGSRGGGRGRR